MWEWEVRRGERARARERGREGGETQSEVRVSSRCTCGITLTRTHMET